MPTMMKVAIFVDADRIVLEDKPIPDVGPLDALIRIVTTIICGTDVHILKGEYPVARGLTVGHEPVGVIEKLGSAVRGYVEGQRVNAGAIRPSGYSDASLCGWRAVVGSASVPALDGLLLVAVGVVFLPILEAEKQLRLALRRHAAAPEIIEIRRMP